MQGFVGNGFAVTVIRLSAILSAVMADGETSSLSEVFGCSPLDVIGTNEVELVSFLPHFNQ